MPTPATNVTPPAYLPTHPPTYLPTHLPARLPHEWTMHAAGPLQWSIHAAGAGGGRANERANNSPYSLGWGRLHSSISGLTPK